MEKAENAAGNSATPFAVAGLWLDGFAQMTPQERRLLRALIPRCGRATLAFCLESEPVSDPAWYSPWSLIGQTYRQCHDELGALAGCDIAVELLTRHPEHNRFGTSPMLQHLERSWSQPRPYEASNRFGVAESGLAASGLGGSGPEKGPAGSWDSSAIRVVTCVHPEGEAAFAAREILKFVRAGGAYREAAVLVRQLDAYHEVIRRVFTRYQIPFFLDRRELVAHHPLAELTRNALRTLAFNWRHDDFFAALKSGLVHRSEEEIDRLENLALEHGWEGSQWFGELEWNGPNGASQQLRTLVEQLTGPFLKLARHAGARPSGRQLADAIGSFWDDLSAGRTLEQWSLGEAPETSGLRSQISDLRSQIPPSLFELRRAGSNPLHATVWDQMRSWLDNLALAFPVEEQSLAEWLPVLEAGLAGLTVGVIPPVLDQVLVGAVDRSRNPDLMRVFVLGLNETVFPAPPPVPVLLTEPDRDRLEMEGCVLGPRPRVQLGHERFYGYIAMTRAREGVVLTRSMRDMNGRALNPSSFLMHVARLFPGLTEEQAAPWPAWIESEHACELVAPLLLNQARPAQEQDPALTELAAFPGLAPVLEPLRHLHPARLHEPLSPERASQLYGLTLQTSVSRIEQFASCPFRFFVNSGLMVEERKRYELDIRQQGSFQHEVLAAFHEEVRGRGQQWRDLPAQEARELIGRIAAERMRTFERGLFEVSGRNRFLARTYQAALQRFIGVAIEWMAQYEFNPVLVEAGFGGKDGVFPAWDLELGGGKTMSFRGRIDRIDLWLDASADTAWCVVIDYKSGQRKLDPVLMHHGVQQQLPAYLNVLRHIPDPKIQLGAARLVPAGVFYVSLRGRYEAGGDRAEVLGQTAAALKRAYQHRGVCTLDALRKLDNRPGAVIGDQFQYRLTNDGQPYKNNATLLEGGAFEALLERQESQLLQTGRRIYDGDTAIDPWKKGRETACDTCEYQSICRIDPWTHRYRALNGPEKP